MGCGKAFLFLIVVPVLCNALDSKDLRKVSQNSISSFEALLTGVNTPLGCFRECLKHSTCDSFAYDGSNKLCYLQVEMDGAAGLLDVYVPVCQEKNAPINYTTTLSVSWQRTLNSLTGDLTCQGDFMPSNMVSANVQCVGTSGQWSFEGECKQRVFKNVVAFEQYPMPTPITPGWTMCIRGTTQAMYRFSFELVRPVDSSIPLHMDWRYGYGYPEHYGIIFDSQTSSGSFLKYEYQNNPSLFADHTETNITYTALALDHIQVTFDRVGLIGFPVTLTYTLHPLTSLGLATHFQFLDYYDGFDIHELTFGC